MSTAQHPDPHTLFADLVSVNHRLTRLAAHAAGGTESPAVWRTLSALMDGPVRLGELAALSRVSQPTMTKLVNKLGELGWVQRLADPADARASVVGITPEGEAARLAWRSRLAGALVPLFSHISPEDATILARSVEILHEGIDAAAPAGATAVISPLEGVEV